MSTIPTITKHNIRTFVGEQNFLKGQQHVRDGAIVNPVQQGVALIQSGPAITSAFWLDIDVLRKTLEVLV
jgi:hypothetical protein